MKKTMYGLIVLVFASPASADITPYANEADFQSQITTPRIADFDGFTGVLTNQYSALGATFAPLSSQALLVDGTYAHSGVNSMYCAPGPTYAAQPWEVLFSTPVKGVGLWTFDLAFSGAIADLYDSSNNLLGSFDLLAVNSANAGNTWAFEGFVSTTADIARMELHKYGQGDAINYDDVQWGGAATVIPAPAAALLGVIGLGLVGWVKRRLA